MDYEQTIEQILRETGAELRENPGQYVCFVCNRAHPKLLAATFYEPRGTTSGLVRALAVCRRCATPARARRWTASSLGAHLTRHRKGGTYRRVCIEHVLLRTRQPLQENLH